MECTCAHTQVRSHTRTHTLVYTRLQAGQFVTNKMQIKWLENANILILFISWHVAVLIGKRLTWILQACHRFWVFSWTLLMKSYLHFRTNSWLPGVKNDAYKWGGSIKLWFKMLRTEEQDLTFKALRELDCHLDLSAREYKRQMSQWDTLSFPK